MDANKNINIETIIKELKKHGISTEKAKEVYSAFLLADTIHRDQKPRETGEPYITHPLNVAYNVLKMGVYDPDTISAALLHDTVEDAKFDFRIQDIAVSINPTVAMLVDGVTKMKDMNFSNRKDEDDANTRKIINGLTKDVRITIIKLGDRQHNMNTMEKKRPEKQRENAIETLNLFVPLAITIGAYRLKNELEELSLKYIEPEVYEAIKDRREKLFAQDEKKLDKMGNKISAKLNEKGIDCDMIKRTQSIYTIFKKIKRGYKIENQYDLNYLKITVDTIDECYRALGIIHSCYKPINGRFKDYIANPRTNNYQGLHTTVADENGNFIKIKIRTRDMDKIDAYGVCAYWDMKTYDNVAPLEYGKTPEETTAIIRRKCQFAKKLMEIDESFKDNSEFSKIIGEDLLTEHVYVYTNTGQSIEMPAGSTALDFVCEVFPDKLDTVTSIVINGKDVSPDEPLKNNDRIQIFEDGKISHEGWENYAKTDKAKIKVKRMNERNNTDK